MRRSVLFLIVLLLLAACSVFDADLAPMPLTPVVLVTATETMTPSPPTNIPESSASVVTPLPYVSCAWQWATQALPDLSAQLTEDMEVAGLHGPTVSASAYGENCMASDDTIDHFAAMQTDMEITVQVEVVQDYEQTIEYTLKILRVLKNYPPGTTPGPMPGQITIRLMSRSPQQALISQKYDVLIAAEAAYTKGSDLLTTLDARFMSSKP